MGDRSDDGDDTGEIPDVADAGAPTDPASAESLAVVSLGAATVDRTYAVSNIPEPDGGAYADSVTESFGGVGANVAVGCARLGRRTGLVARLGEDETGARVAADLEETAVETSHVRRKPGTSTHCVVLRDGTGKRSIVTAGDSARLLRLTESDLAALERADAVFLTAYNPDPVHRAVLDAADEPGFPPVAFDLSGPLAELAGRGAREETVDGWAAAADLFVVGEVAAESYLGCTGRAAAETLRERGATRVAATSGPDGAVLADPDGVHELPAFDVAVTDETGAGDAYVAALVDRWLLAGEPTPEAGRFAAAAAALNVRESGARGGLATREEVEAFLADR